MKKAAAIVSDGLHSHSSVSYSGCGAPVGA